MTSTVCNIDAIVEMDFDEVGLEVAGIAESLAAVSERVVQEHIDAMRRAMPEAIEGLTDLQIADDLPDVLGDAVHLLRGNDDGERRLRLRSPAHGTARYGQGFEVADLATEYALLRRTMLCVLYDELGRPLSIDESASIHRVIDFVTGHTTTAFVRQKEEEIRLQTDSISRFLASLAHDLRNDVNGAMLALRVAEQSLAPGGEAPSAEQLAAMREELAEARQTMHGTLSSMTRILESEKLQAKIDATRRSDVSLHALLQSVSRSTVRSLRNRVLDAQEPETPSSADVCSEKGGLEIHVECPMDAVVFTDPELASTILLNLTGNAVKYGGECEVTLRATGIAGGGWKIDVIDRGPGIEPERLETLFEEFNRAGRIGGDGVGLGLSIARRAADLIEAKLSVESAVGEGSTFSLELPAGEAA